MPSERLEFQLDAKGRLTAFNQAGKDLEKTSKASKETGGALEKLTKVVGAAAAAFGALKAAQAAVKFAQIGAGVEAAHHQLVAFAGGTQEANAYLNAFLQGADNTIDRMTAMQSAGQMLGMGLVKSTAEMQQMASIAIRLGDQTQTVEQRMENFTAMLANQSKPRLDSFKIASGEATARIEKLTEAGMDADKAFAMVVMEMGQERLEKLGDTSEMLNNKFSRLSAAFKDARDISATAFAKFIEGTGIIDRLIGVVEQLPMFFFQAGKWIIDTAEKVTLTSIKMFAVIKSGVAWVVKFVTSGFRAKEANEAFRESMLKSLTTLRRTENWFQEVNNNWAIYKKSVQEAAGVTEQSTARIIEANARAAGSSASGQKGQFIQTQLSKIRPMQERMLAAGSSWAFINEQMAAFQANVFKQAEQLYGKGGPNPTFQTPGVTNNYNLTYQTTRSGDSVKQDFHGLQALNGAP